MFLRFNGGKSFINLDNVATVEIKEDRVEIGFNVADSQTEMKLVEVWYTDKGRR